MKLHFSLVLPTVSRRSVLLFSSLVHDCGRDRKVKVDLLGDEFLRQRQEAGGLRGSWRVGASTEMPNPGRPVPMHPSRGHID